MSLSVVIKDIHLKSKNILIRMTIILISTSCAVCLGQMGSVDDDMSHLWYMYGPGKMFSHTLFSDSEGCDDLFDQTFAPNILVHV